LIIPYNKFGKARRQHDMVVMGFTTARLDWHSLPRWPRNRPVPGGWPLAGL